MVQGIQDTKVMKHHNISDDDDLDNLNNFIVESPSNKVVNIRFKVFIFLHFSNQSWEVEVSICVGNFLILK